MQKKSPSKRTDSAAAVRWWQMNRGLLLVVLLACVSFTASVLIFYPGHMTNDSMQQWAQVMGEAPVNDWHPPLMVYVWKVAYLLTGRPSGLLILQLAMLWSSLGALSYYCLRHAGKSAATLPFVFGWLPFVVGISGALWKDVLMAFALFAASTLLLLHYWKGRRSWGVAALTLCLIGAAALLRHNALAAIVPLLVMWTMVYIPNVSRIKRTGLTAAMILLVAVCGALFTAVTHTIATHPSGAVMLDDIVFSPTDPASSKSPFLDERLAEIRDTCAKNGITVNSYWGCLDDEERLELSKDDTYNGVRQAWLESIFEHPVAYVQYRIYTYALFLFVPEQRSYTYADGIMTNSYGLHERSPYLSKALGVYVESSSRGLFEFVFKPWFWLLLSLAPLALMVLGRIRHQPFVAALAASSIVYILTYFPVVVAADYRYIYWPVLATSLAWLILFVEHKRPARPRITTH